MIVQTVVERIVPALPGPDAGDIAIFRRSHRHGQRELVRLTEQLAGELYIQCLMDPDLGIDQDLLGEAIGSVPPRDISSTMWATLSNSESAFVRFRTAYARRYLEDVLARLPLLSATTTREAA